MEIDEQMPRLLRALEESIHALEAHIAANDRTELKAVLARRRRAYTALRTALRSDGATRHLVPQARSERQSSAPSLDELRRQERGLLALYRELLESLRDADRERGRLLRAQRAETEQANLVLSRSRGEYRL